MKNLNNYLSLIKPSLIRQFSEKKTFVNLSIGEDKGQPPFLFRMLAFMRSGSNYISGKGFLPLRKEIKKFVVKEYGLDYDLDEILITAGSSNALDLALRVILNPGDEVIIPKPSYVAYEPLVLALGCKVIAYELTANDNYEIKAKKLSSLITAKTKLLIMNYPHNPTGAMMSYDNLLALSKIVEKYDLYVISDEIYSMYAYQKKHYSIAGFPGMKERSIVLNGASKSFKMTGHRLGYALAPVNIINGMLSLFQYSIISTSAYSMYLAYYCYKYYRYIKSGIIKQYAQKRKYLMRKLDSLQLKYFIPDGAFYFWLLIPNSLNVCRYLLDNGLAVTPGIAFQNDDRMIRISYTVKLKQLKRFFSCLKKLMNPLNKC